MLGKEYDIFTLKQMEVLRLPYAEAGETCYTDARGSRYCLYPNLMKGEMVQTCKTCAKALRKNEVPEFSLGSGVDFGIHELDALNEVEKAVISRSIIVSKVIKLRPCSESDGQLALKGHVVSMPHDLVDTITTKLPRTKLPIQVMFIGKERFWGATKNLFKLQYHVRPTVIFKWLRYLKSRNPLYFDIEINESDETIVCLEKITPQLAEEAILSSNPETNYLETSVEEETETFSGSSSSGLKSVMLCDKTKKPNSADHAFLALKKLKIRLRTGSLKNEFLENSEIFAESFPWLFTLGNVIRNFNPCNKNLMNYLLNFYDCRFAHDMDFVFYCFNQKQRWNAVISVGIRVKSNPQSILAFKRIIEEENFDKDLETAMKDHQSLEARSLLLKISNIVKISGKHLDFGPCQRESSLSKLYSYFHFFGYPSCFFTMSPADVDQILTFRFSHEIGERDFELPSLNERYHILAKNPVAASQIFHRIKNAFFESLFGLMDSSKTRKSIEISDRCIGSFGTPIAFFAADESQGRGSLHMHAILWCGIPPDTIQKHINNKKIMEETIKVVDSMVRAYIPSDQVPENDDIDQQGSRQHFYTGECVPPLESCQAFTKFEERAYAIAKMCNTHRHSATCRKGKTGRFGCRFLIPSAICESTGAVELKYTLSGSSVSNVEPNIHITEKPSRESISFRNMPLPLPDPRIISFDLKRPTENDKMIIPFSRVCSATLACNTAAHPILSPAQAQSIAFYTLKYITKDSVAVVNALSCLSEAKRSTQLRPSIASNHGTETRSAQHIITRLLNNLNSKMEISGQMAASSILGNSTISASHETWYCFPWPLLKSYNFWNQEENDCEQVLHTVEDELFNEEEIRIEEFMGSDEHSYSEISVDSRNRVQVTITLKVFFLEHILSFRLFRNTKII